MYMAIKEIVDAANKSQKQIYELAIEQEINKLKLLMKKFGVKWNEI